MVAWRSAIARLPLDAQTSSTYCLHSVRTMARAPVGEAAYGGCAHTQACNVHNPMEVCNIHVRTPGQYMPEPRQQLCKSQMALHCAKMSYHETRREWTRVCCRFHRGNPTDPPNRRSLSPAVSSVCHGMGVVKESPIKFHLCLG